MKGLAIIKRIFRGFSANNCSIHAAGLTYFSLLAIVPIICCILVVAKACNVDEYARGQLNTQIDSMIVNIEKGQDDRLAHFTPISAEERERRKIAAEEFGREARKISNELFERIEKVNVGTLGWIGFAFLLWTVISTLGTVEVSFNQIWGVKKARPIWKRAYMYLFISIILPVVAAVAMSVPILVKAKAFGYAFSIAATSLALGYFLWVMPNCKVRFSRAWLGGLITAMMLAIWIKACAVAQVGIAKSSMLYGSFAFMPIILAWFYMSWQIVLLGANVVKVMDERGVRG